jgi:hypothetical protein
MPVKQLFYADCVEVLPEVLEEEEGEVRSLSRFLGKDVATKLE